jgi:hypothetical protein
MSKSTTQRSPINLNNHLNESIHSGLNDTLSDSDQDDADSSNLISLHFSKVKLG